MGMSTRTDEDLQNYYQAILNKDYVENEDIQKVLDAYRIKFALSMVYVAEIQADRKSLMYTHVSFEAPCNLLGTRRAITSQERKRYAHIYDEEGLCEYSPNSADEKPSQAILHYGIFRRGKYDGRIGLVCEERSHKWTDEERAALQKLGRVLRNVLYVERNIKVSAADQEKLNHQDHVLEAIFATTDCGMMRHSLDGDKIISINKAALKILGYENEQELMEEGFQLIANSVMEEDKPKLRECIKDLQEVGDSANIDYRVCHKDGAILNVIGKIKLLEEDGVLFYQRFLFDYTVQRKQEEEKYQEEKARQSELIQALSVDFNAVYFADLDTGMAVALRTNQQMGFHFTEDSDQEFLLEEGLERYIQEAVYEGDRALLRRAASISSFNRELSKGEAYYTNYRTVLQGKVEYFQMKAVRAGTWGKSHHIVIGFRSVDEEIRNEMAQKKLVEDSYEIIAGLSSDYNFIALFDAKDGKMSVYKANEDSLEVAALASKTYYWEAVSAYSKYVYEIDQEFWESATKLECVLEQLQHMNIYNVNIRNNSHEKLEYVQFSFTKVSRQDQKSQIVLAKRIITDTVEQEINQRKLVENALAQAEQANAAKSTFLSNMSHDIRTPMNAIIGFTALATTHIDQKERVQEYLGKIMSSGNHLLSLINDVLDMSRIESGKIYIDEKLFRLPELLHELRNILRSDLTAKQLDFYIDAVDVMNEEIFCDGLRLNQVLLNLLSNSVKFTDPGGTITMRVIEKPSPVVGYANYEFYIKDTGIGMDQGFLKHIFEPFERERTSTISGIQGTGLGLAITKNIVEMMGGTIEVKSIKGKGTEFLVSLSFRLSTTTAIPQIIPELEGCRGLVVDDDFNTCDSVTAMLQQMGLRSEWTTSGKEAVARTKQARDKKDEYYVYMIDWHIPDMDGIEVAKRIRAEVGEAAPIIVLTAYEWADIEKEAKEAGITAFCSKPVFFSELRGCLEKFVNSKNPSEAPPEPVSQEPSGGRILLTEDNELNREIATEILEEEGFEIETAENGKIAVDMIRNSEPGYFQLVLMDVQMPVMNGYDATIAIRSLENKELASIPIFAMTANAFEEDKQTALRRGMNGHIAKPIDVEKLLGTVNSVLRPNKKVSC